MRPKTREHSSEEIKILLARMIAEDSPAILFETDHELFKKLEGFGYSWEEYAPMWRTGLGFKELEKSASASFEVDIRSSELTGKEVDRLAQNIEEDMGKRGYAVVSTEWVYGLRGSCIPYREVELYFTNPNSDGQIQDHEER